MIEALEAGFLTTVQDGGRPGLGHLGVPISGAADPWSLAVANVLVGNLPDAAALEVTAAGPRLRALATTLVAVAGADVRAAIGDASLAPGRAAILQAGEILGLAGPRVGGLRAYVALAGGIDVPLVLGARATYVPGAFGGVEGRPLRAGDRLALAAAGTAPVVTDPSDAWPGEPIAPRSVDESGATILRVLAGPAGREAAAALSSMGWVVSPTSDRMGIRLEPDPRDPASRDAAPPPSAAGLPSHGVVPGVVQLPPDGRPIVLGVDHQTTGGYPVAGVVIAADLAVLGQLAPGDRVRVEPVDTATARRLLREQRAAWDDASATLRGEAAWDALWRSAGA